MVDVTLMHITVYDDDIAGEKTLRFSDAEGFDPETVSYDVYEPRIIDAGNYAEYLYGRGTTIGLSEAGRGQFTLNNADGALDGMRNYGYGRTIEILRGTSTLADPTDFTTVFTGTTLGALRYTALEVAGDIRNKLAEIYELPFLTVKYDGDTTDTTYGSGGHVNGTANDIKGKNRPMLFGNGGGKYFSPPVVNTAKQTVQISQHECDSIDELLVGGAALSAGTAHASLTALQAATVSSGYYDYYLGNDALDEDDPARGCYARIGSAIDGDITAAATASSNNLVNCIKEALEFKGLTVDASSFSAMASTFSAAGGIWVGPEEINTGDIIAAMLAAFNGYLYVTTAGVFKIGQLTDPSAGSSVLTLTNDLLAGDDATKLRRFPSSDETGDVPVSRIIYNYNYNYTVQAEADLPGAATQAQKEFSKNEWRAVYADAASSVTTKHPTAQPFVINALITDSTAAQNEADRQKTLRTATREFAEITVHESLVRDVDLGDIITVESERYSDAGSDQWLVMGKVIEYAVNQVTLILWK